ncbi:sigma-54 dependent transcriptional regulator [Iodidimonas sp. SYSU 1G8]|uniref:sigma-54-dependent transcriptional regulator n=1 Tax=Iodidimonas sp. SYSU 1G8 TaxID=3133967 RepID=UPI0031FE68EE
MMEEPTILIVEDSVALASTYREYLRQVAASVVAVENGTQAMEWLKTNTPAAILLDLRLPDMDGMEILKNVQARKLISPVIVMTAHGSINAAVDAMRGGAFDFLMKPFAADRLVTTIRNALSHRQLQTEVLTLRSTLGRDRFHGLIGASLPMQAVYRSIESAAQSKASIFIYGESGTGKELCTQAIHQASARRDGPFVALNCAAIPRELMESEVFGHRKGAFTGAVADREGAAGRADGGTLFLDEICEMDIALQAKLLRFLQTQSYSRVGDDVPRQVNVRFVCATNKDPLEEVRAGRFREDLYYRLHVIPIDLPPLRDRGDDILLLAHAFLEEFSEEEGLPLKVLTPQAEAALLAYRWPGNVREMRNRIHSALVLTQGSEIGPQDLGIAAPAKDAEFAIPQTPVPSISSDPPIVPLWQVEKEAIERAIAHWDGNINKAAAALEISPSTIYRKMERWGAGN